MYIKNSLGTRKYFLSDDNPSKYISQIITVTTVSQKEGEVA